MMLWQKQIGQVIISIKSNIFRNLTTFINNQLYKNMDQIDKFLNINTLPSHYEDLFFLWQNRDIEMDEEIELFQFLIDTELAWEIDENFERRAEYFIAEGLCYFVPSEKTS